jgi:hypothetical protein
MLSRRLIRPAKTHIGDGASWRAIDREHGGWGNLCLERSGRGRIVIAFDQFEGRSDAPSRPEAIRRLVELGLKAKGK